MTDTKSPLQRLYKRLFRAVPPFPPAEPLLFNLPECLLRDTFELLPLVDQACLSVTCKLFQYLFSSVLKHEEFRFARFQHLIRPDLRLYSEDTLRNQLLIQLEDEKWAFCGGCLKLHPRKEFEPQSSLILRPLERRCMPNAGIVDICPCISLTFRDQMRIAKSLKRKSSRVQAKPPMDNWGVFKVGTDARGKPHLAHECLIADDAGIKVQSSMRILINPRHRRLAVHVNYIIHTGPRDVTGEWEPKFACPMMECLRDVRSGQRMTDVAYAALKENYRNPGPEHVVTMSRLRLLGRPSSWPADDEWFEQSRPRSDICYRLIWTRTRKESE